MVCFNRIYSEVIRKPPQPTSRWCFTSAVPRNEDSQSGGEPSSVVDLVDPSFRQMPEVFVCAFVCVYALRMCTVFTKGLQELKLSFLTVLWWYFHIIRGMDCYPSFLPSNCFCNVSGAVPALSELPSLGWGDIPLHVWGSGARVTLLEHRHTWRKRKRVEKRKVGWRRGDKNLEARQESYLYSEFHIKGNKMCFTLSLRRIERENTHSNNSNMIIVILIKHTGRLLKQNRKKVSQEIGHWHSTPFFKVTNHLTEII